MKILLNRLQKKYGEGENLTFDIVNHKSIPNTVFSNGIKLGYITLATYNAYITWKNKIYLDIKNELGEEITFKKNDSYNESILIAEFINENEFFWSNEFFAFCSKLETKISDSLSSKILKGLLEDNLIQPIEKKGNSTKYIRV